MSLNWVCLKMKLRQETVSHLLKKTTRFRGTTRDVVASHGQKCVVRDINLSNAVGKLLLLCALFCLIYELPYLSRTGWLSCPRVPTKVSKPEPHYLLNQVTDIIRWDNYSLIVKGQRVFIL
jgi:hypothetical protein